MLPILTVARGKLRGTAKEERDESGEAWERANLRGEKFFGGGWRGSGDLLGEAEGG